MAILYLDIETVGNPEMERFIMTDARPPKSYKKQASIDNWFIEEADRRLGKMAIDIDYSRIVALGYAVDDGEIVSLVADDPAEEWRTLASFWDTLGRLPHPRICGFNVLGFDIPIILRRSWRWGVKPTYYIDMRRYTTKYVIDLMQLLYNWGQAPGVRYRGLKALAEMYGIDNPLPDLDGSMVAEMDGLTLTQYCANDVRMTRELANRTRGYYWV